MESNPLRAVDIKQHNQKIILSYIYESRNTGGCSQSELVFKTGLKAPSVFRIFSFLEESGFIKPCSGSSSDGNLEIKKGRKPSFYTVCPDICYTIGLEFWAACISLGVFNFNGERIHTSLFNIPKDFDAYQVLDKIVLLVNNAITLLDLPKEKIIGIGVAAPGKVDVSSGDVVFYNRIRGMQAFPLRESLRMRLGLNVIVHNNCSAIAYNISKYSKMELGKSTFVFLIRSGVNGALVSNGQIYVSADQTTLEAGHLPINFDGPRCSCGLNGCLQAYIYELDRQYNDGGESMNLFSNLDSSLENHDPKAIELINKASFYLYTGMKSIIRFLAPESFVIISPSWDVSQELCNGVTRLFKEENDNFLKRKPLIHPMEYDNLLAQRGASDLVLNEFFC